MSLSAALRTLSSVDLPPPSASPMSPSSSVGEGGRRWALLGDMLELGPEEGPKAHEGAIKEVRRSERAGPGLEGRVLDWSLSNAQI